MTDTPKTVGQMRDAILNILPPFQDGYISREDIADEIIRAIPVAEPDDDDLTTAYLKGFHDGKAARDPRVAALVEALEWYAEQARLAKLIHSEGDLGRASLAKDGGKKALAALAAFEGGDT